VAGSSDLGFEILSSLHDDDGTPNKPPTLNLPCVMLEAKMSDPGQVFLGRQSIYEEDEHRMALYGTKYDTSARAYKHSVATVWAFDKLSPEAKGLMKLMLFMDPNAIQESILFDGAAQMFGSSFTRPKFNEARAELSQSSLIRQDKRKTPLSDYQISVRRLVQDAIRSSLNDQEMISIFEIMIHLLWRAWPQAMPPPTKPSIFLQHEAADTRYSMSRYPLCVHCIPTSSVSSECGRKCANAAIVLKSGLLP